MVDGFIGSSFTVYFFASVSVSETKYLNVFKELVYYSNNTIWKDDLNTFNWLTNIWMD